MLSAWVVQGCQVLPCHCRRRGHTHSGGTEGDNERRSPKKTWLDAVLRPIIVVYRFRNRISSFVAHLCASLRYATICSRISSCEMMRCMAQLHSRVKSELKYNLSQFNTKFLSSAVHTEVKYSIAGEEFQAAKQFILSSFGIKLYLSWWCNGLRHQASRQKAVGWIPTWGDFFLNVNFSKNFFFLKL